MQRAFHTGHAGLFRESVPAPKGQRFSFEWPLTQALMATLGVAGMPGMAARFASDVRGWFAALERYWDGRARPPAYASSVMPPLGAGGDIFYDDNAWAGLAFIQQHRMTGDAWTLRCAVNVFDFLVTGWDDEPSHAAPGGIFWTRARGNRDRNLVSTIPPAALGLHLFELTREGRYLDWARRMLMWADTCLRDQDGLYWDHIGLDGAVDTARWSYNQGAVIAAHTLLSRVTGDRAALARAAEIAGAALRLYAGDGFAAQDPVFNAIFFRNLLLLDTERADPAHRAAMQRYGEQAWNSARDPASGLFRFKPGSPVSLLDQAAMVQIYAYLAWEPAMCRRLA
jgi:hypothetical protein